MTEIIKYETNELAWFFLTNQPLFGLGLTSTANRKIEQI
jgi:hypothetical protein